METIVAPKLTYEDLRKMPEDGRRYELMDGEVYMIPPPNTKHQVVVGNLYVALRRFADGTGIGKVFVAPFDVVFGERTAVQPDLLFIRKKRLSILTDLNVQGAPDLVIEVLSPSTAAFERETNLQVYARAGLPEVWYVDPKEEIVEVLNLSPARRYQEDRKAGRRCASCLPGASRPSADTRGGFRFIVRRNTSDGDGAVRSFPIAQVRTELEGLPQTDGSRSFASSFAGASEDRSLRMTG